MFIAGCGDSNDKTSSSTTTAATTTSSDSTTKSEEAKPAAGAVEVSMKDIQFNPPAVDAKVGQTVKWTNDDTVLHNATATSGADFKSKDFGEGGTYEYKLEKAGTVKYTCTLHPGMDGTITVSK